MYVKKFVEGTFTPDLSVKQINGREITTLELFEYFRAYCRIFEAGELPEPMSMLRATAEANNLAAKALAKEFYINAMEQHCGGDRPYMHPQHLQTANRQIEDEALSRFNAVPKMGGEAMSAQYLDELRAEMHLLYDNFMKHNDSKNIFAFSRTATSLCAIMIITYIASGILEWLWLGSLAFILNFVFWTCFALLSAWIYVKYSGEYKEIGEYIDGLADFLWRQVTENSISIEKTKSTCMLCINIHDFSFEKIYQPLYERFIQHAIRAMLSYAPIQEGPSSSSSTASSASRPNTARR